MLIKGLELMFLKKRQIPVNRLAAFTKRFTLVALNMPNKTVLQCLALVDRLVQVSSKKWDGERSGAHLFWLDIDRV